MVTSVQKIDLMRKGLFFTDNEFAAQIKTKLEQELANSFSSLGKAVIDEDNFFDACAQALSQHKTQLSAKELRQSCYQYILELNTQSTHPNWLYQHFVTKAQLVFPMDPGLAAHQANRDYQSFIAAIERENGHLKSNTAFKPINMPAEILEKIVCLQYGVQIHKLSLPTAVGLRSVGLPVKHRLVNAHGEQEIFKDEVDYLADDVIHLAEFEGRQVPVMKSGIQIFREKLLHKIQMLFTKEVFAEFLDDNESIILNKKFAITGKEVPLAKSAKILVNILYDLDVYNHDLGYFRHLKVVGNVLQEAYNLDAQTRYQMACLVYLVQNSVSEMVNEHVDTMPGIEQHLQLNDGVIKTALSGLLNVTGSEVETLAQEEEPSQSKSGVMLTIDNVLAQIQQIIAQYKLEVRQQFVLGEGGTYESSEGDTPLIYDTKQLMNGLIAFKQLYHDVQTKSSKNPYKYYREIVEQFQQVYMIFANIALYQDSSPLIGAALAGYQPILKNLLLIIDSFEQSFYLKPGILFEQFNPVIEKYQELVAKFQVTCTDKVSYWDYLIEAKTLEWKKYNKRQETLQNEIEECKRIKALLADPQNFYPKNDDDYFAIRNKKSLFELLDTLSTLGLSDKQEIREELENYSPKGFWGNWFSLSSWMGLKPLQKLYKALEAHELELNAEWERIYEISGHAFNRYLGLKQLKQDYEEQGLAIARKPEAIMSQTNVSTGLTAVEAQDSLALQERLLTVDKTSSAPFSEKLAKLRQQILTIINTNFDSDLASHFRDPKGNLIEDRQFVVEKHDISVVKNVKVLLNILHGAKEWGEESGYIWKNAKLLYRGIKLKGNYDSQMISDAFGFLQGLYADSFELFEQAKTTVAKGVNEHCSLSRDEVKNLLSDILVDAPPPEEGLEQMPSDVFSQYLDKFILKLVEYGLELDTKNGTRFFIWDNELGVFKFSSKESPDIRNLKSFINCCMSFKAAYASNYGTSKFENLKYYLGITKNILMFYVNLKQIDLGQQLRGMLRDALLGLNAIFRDISIYLDHVEESLLLRDGLLISQFEPLLQQYQQLVEEDLAQEKTISFEEQAFKSIENYPYYESRLHARMERRKTAEDELTQVLIEKQNLERLAAIYAKTPNLKQLSLEELSFIQANISLLPLEDEHVGAYKKYLRETINHHAEKQGWYEWSKSTFYSLGNMLGFTEHKKIHQGLMNNLQRLAAKEQSYLHYNKLLDKRIQAITMAKFSYEEQRRAELEAERKRLTSQELQEDKPILDQTFSKPQIKPIVQKPKKALLVAKLLSWGEQILDFLNGVGNAIEKVVKAAALIFRPSAKPANSLGEVVRKLADRVPRLESCDEDEIQETIAPVVSIEAKSNLPVKVAEDIITDSDELGQEETRPAISSP